MLDWEKYASAIYAPPYPEIPSNWRLLWREKGTIKSAWRRIKRDLILLGTGQIFLLKDRIPATARRILIVYRARPQLGDSIQELSGRTLLQSPGRTIDLYTEKVIADIYAGDTVFDKVCSNIQELRSDYDFIVLMTMSWKNLAPKLKVRPWTRFSVVYGYSHGIELDQLGLSYAAFSHMNQLQRPATCRPVFNLRYSHAPVPRDRHAVAIAVGGVGSDRIYQHWPAVVERLLEARKNDPDFKILLLGSGNGRTDADNILARLGDDPRVHDLVGKTTLEESFEHLKQVGLMVCADGGLMHIATCAGTPLVSLFANVIHPLFRLKKHASALAIHAPREVSEIAPDEIATLVLSAADHPPESLSIRFLGAEPDFL